MCYLNYLPNAKTYMSAKSSAYILAKPSSEANLLETQKLEAQVELSKIKSVQLELVKHSKLSRAIIKFEKQLEVIQAQYAPKALSVKKYARFTRVCGHSMD